MGLFTELKRRNVIRVAAAYLVAVWLLAQVANVGADAFDAPAWVMKMVITLLVIGFVPTLIFSWIYELTPEGLKRESEIESDDSITTHTARKLDIAVIVLLVAAIGLFVIDRLISDRSQAAVPVEESVRSEPPESVGPAEKELALGVAVIPFKNLSPDPDNAFFAAGVHDDLLTHLSRVAALRVISRTTVIRYADSDLSLPEIGRELGVSHVLEGTVRRAGRRVLVTVQLIDAVTDDHVWAEKYERPLENIFAIQNEIAQTVVAQVEAKLTPQEAASLAKIPTTNTEAYDEYLRGLEQRRVARIGVPLTDFDSIGAHFFRATELDPDFLAAWMMTMEFSAGAVWYDEDPDGKHLRRVRAALARIQALAPNSPESDLALGLYHYYVERDLGASFAAFERATAARPNDTQALLFLARVARRLQHWDTMLTADRRLILLDPASPSSRTELINHLRDSTDYGAAIIAATEGIQRFPNEKRYYVQRAVFLAQHTGDVTHVRRLVDADWTYYYIPEATLIRGVFADTDEAVAWFEANYPTASWYRVNYVVGVHLLAGGDAERARLRFRAAYDQYSAIVDENKEARRLEVVGFVGLLAALAGEHEAALEHRERALAEAAATDDILVEIPLRWDAARALAVLGEVEEAWIELEPLVGKPRGPTEWDLALRIGISYFFADSEGYQARVAKLEVPD